MNLKYILEIRKHPLFKIFVAILIISFTGANLIIFLEHNLNSEQFESLGDGIWWALVTMTTVGYGDRVPVTPAGRTIGVLIMFTGVALVSLFTATISSIYVARQIKEGRGLEQIKLRNHLIICGWNFNAEQILSSFLNQPKSSMPVVLVNQLSEEAISDIFNNFAKLKIKFVRGDFTKEVILQRANIQHANHVMILPDASAGLGVKSDELTILATLTIKTLNPKIKVFAHVVDRENVSHMKRAKVDGLILSNAYAGFLMAAHVMSPGIPQAVELLFSEETPFRLDRENLPGDFENETFLKIRDHFYKEHKAIALGIGKEMENVRVDDLLSDDYSYLDEYIKRKFAEAGRGFNDESRIKIFLNPPDETILQANDFIILLKGRA
jgi:voltage-gated potassium channel